MKFNYIKYIFLTLATLQFSCKKLVEIDPPKNSLVQATVFQNDDQATATVTGMYATMEASIFYASGGSWSITALSGLSADELVGYSTYNIPFYENQVAKENLSLSYLYSEPYISIYTANAILDGLAKPNKVTAPVKAQLEGESLFVRAFAYFYLVNLFGPVPLQLSTDYQITQITPRSSVSLVYEQILTDLKNAEILLSESYPTEGRVRPNKSAAQAMLARTYLYLQDWPNAEKYASLVISKSSIYNLVDLDDVFLANSKEAIWQLMPPQYNNTQEGLMFILQDVPYDVSLRSSFAINAFEANDKRRDAWVKSFTIGSQTYYYPFKYKVKSSSAVTEYSMVLRLAEQFLIRAEARINQGNIGSGLADLNIIRDRARPLPTSNNPNPLPPLLGTLDKNDALLAIEQERKVELFSEWGHRWLDLKRTGRIDDILSTLKTKWQKTDALYPIPSNEIDRNPKITQNPGY